MLQKNGSLVISLDFELFWGVRVSRSIESYGKSVEQVPVVIEKMLLLFEKYNVRATFATVGLIGCDSASDACALLPTGYPQYDNRRMSPFDLNYLEETADRYPSLHFNKDLIRLIQKYPRHEISSHTFSHYYCLEKGQSVQEFEADLKAENSLMERFGIVPKSLIFPRNQYNPEYLEACSKNGIIIVRGNEKSWLYKQKKRMLKLRRLLRFVDTYINISGYNTFKLSDCEQINGVFNLPASRFLRPYIHKLRCANFLKYRRITSAMKHAAKNGEVFHLWWHPHNFGANVEQNIIFLEKVLKYHQHLSKKYGFSSDTMLSLYEEYQSRKFV